MSNFLTTAQLGELVVDYVQSKLFQTEVNALVRFNPYDYTFDYIYIEEDYGTDHDDEFRAVVEGRKYESSAGLIGFLIPPISPLARLKVIAEQIKNDHSRT